MSQRVQSLSDLCSKVASRLSFSFGLAIVTACGGGGGGGASSDGASSNTGNGATPGTSSLPSTQPKPTVMIFGLASAVQVGAAQTLGVLAIGDISSYRWDFGDGTKAKSGSRVSHSWTKAGRYVVTVAATDVNGETATDTKAIDVVIDTPPANCTSLLPKPESEVVVSGAGLIPLFRYVNDSDCAYPVNISVERLSSGSLVTLVYSNGHAEPTASGATAPDVHPDVGDEDAALLVAGGMGDVVVGRLRAALVASEQRDRRAARRELLRCRTTQPRRAAGEEDDLAREVVGAGRLPVVEA